MEWFDLIEQIMYLVISVAVPVLTSYGIKFLKSRSIWTEMQEKEELVQKGVEFVEQVYHDYNGPEQYNIAIQWISNRLNEKGIPYTEEELHGLIEAAIYEMKAAWYDALIEED